MASKIDFSIERILSHVSILKSLGLGSFCKFSRLDSSEIRRRLLVFAWFQNPRCKSTPNSWIHKSPRLHGGSTLCSVESIVVLSKTDIHLQKISAFQFIFQLNFHACSMRAASVSKIWVDVLIRELKYGGIQDTKSALNCPPLARKLENDCRFYLEASWKTGSSKRPPLPD